PAVARGRIVNRTWGEKQLAERHDAADFKALGL
ncbi:glutathione-dependent disulfide-bond oxidoreductase, partial [Klebsiella pneumoniae]|nr:glutathione-dependent disulfide-bond oxidoreductase [Klebsiella pneumoniae]